MKFAYDIPDSFWSLFRSMNRELYMEALLKINEEYEYNNYYLSKEVCPVSYTHLDVYKRQVRCSEIRKYQMAGSS